MRLDDLEIYKLSQEIASEGWEVYSELNWQEKKIIGDQWLQAIDSIGANIAEGFGRFHYLDRNRFFYNSRGSIQESIHWTTTMIRRKIGDQVKLENISIKLVKLNVKLNNFIAVTREQKTK